MKTKMLLLFLLSFICISGLQSQAITNGSFENWSQQLLYEDPVPYITTNMNVFMMGAGSNVTKSTDHHGGNFSARLETILAGTDTVFGGMFIGMPGSGGISGGYAISTHPDSLRLFTKFDVKPNDTAYVLVLFKNAGSMIGVGSFKFYGTQNSFTEYKSAVNWFSLVNTDTIAVIVTASNLDYAKIPGSTIYLDDLSFVNSVTPFPNGDFETWNSVSVENPDDWFTMNFANSPGNYSVTQSTDSYDGIYAAQIENVITTYGDTMGFITNGRFGSNGPEGGMHVLLNPEKVNGYYKYTPVGLDTALAGCFIFGYDNFGNYGLLDSSLIKLEPKTSYTYFEIPIAYNSWPLADTLNISFASGNIENGNSFVGLGSTLLIDKLEVFYKPMSVNESSAGDNTFNIFPNPANGVVSINSHNGQPYYIELYNENGQKMYSEFFNTAGTFVNHLNLSALSKGFYYLKIQNGENSISKKLIIQ